MYSSTTSIPLLIHFLWQAGRRPLTGLLVQLPFGYCMPHLPLRSREHWPMQLTLTKELLIVYESLLCTSDCRHLQSDCDDVNAYNSKYHMTEVVWQIWVSSAFMRSSRQRKYRCSYSILAMASMRMATTLPRRNVLTI
jgi:hypothetical protein